MLKNAAVLIIASHKASVTLLVSPYAKKRGVSKRIQARGGGLTLQRWKGHSTAYKFPLAANWNQHLVKYVRARAQASQTIAMTRLNRTNHSKTRTNALNDPSRSIFLSFFSQGLKRVTVSCFKNQHRAYLLFTTGTIKLLSSQGRKERENLLCPKAALLPATVSLFHKTKISIWKKA